MNQHITDLLAPQVDAPLTEWLYYIQHLHSKSIDLSLDRIRYVANNLNLLQPAPFVITVSGTNGKGTTCKLLEAILLSHGLRVGVFNSPHLLSYTERVRINGQQLIETDHSKAMSIIETGRHDISLSYFEFSTLSALQLFCQAMLDIVILEVGLGGRLDATNIINADVAVITNVALDHTTLLGLDRNSIASEKAGIIRYGKPLIIGDLDRPIILDKLAAQHKVMLFARDRDWGFSIEEHDSWNWWGPDIEFRKLPLPIIPLDNAATVLAILQCLPFSVGKHCIYQGLQNAMLPGRFQIICQQPLVILDVAHNPHAANYLACQLATLHLPQNSKMRAVVGMLADKDIPGTLNYLRDKVDIWYCATIPDQNAASAEELATWLLNSHTYQFNNVTSAWQQALLDAAPEDCILVFGSFHTVASVMKEHLCLK